MMGPAARVVGLATRRPLLALAAVLALLSPVPPLPDLPLPEGAELEDLRA